MEKYTEFENLVREPKGEFLALIQSETEINYDSVTVAVAHTLGWTKVEVQSYFDCYSDWYKDYWGVRPRSCWRTVFAYCEDMRRTGVYSAPDYEDYAELKRLETLERERDERIQRERHERLLRVCEGVSLNGVPLTPEMLVGA